jgi:hypothetical protein
MKYQIEYLRNHRCVIHVDVRLTRQQSINTWEPPKEVGDQPEHQLISRVMDIPGMCYMTMGPYDIEIGIGKLFSLKTIVPEILEMIRGLYAPFDSCDAGPAIEYREPIEVTCPHCGFHKKFRSISELIYPTDDRGGTHGTIS